MNIRTTNKERFLQSTLDALLSHLAILDESGTIIAVNRAWRKFAQANGASAETVSEGVNYLAVCDSARGENVEEAAATAAGIRAILRGEQETFAIEYPCHSPDEKRWFICRVTSFFDDEKIRVVVKHENITERKFIEELLLESEEKFKYVFENSVIGKTITLLSGEIQANKAFCEMLGYSSEELQHKKWEEMTHPEDLEISQNVVTALLSGKKKSARFVKRYFHKNGSTIWTDVSSSLRRDKYGKPLYFITSVSDISKMVQAEETLRESKLRYQTLTEMSPVGIFRTDPQGHTTYVNPRWCKISGLNAAEAMGEGWLSAVHPEDRDLLAAGWEQATLSKSKSESEYRFQRPDGTVVWVMGLAVPERDTNGRITSYIGTITDITDLKKAGETLRLQSSALLSTANGIVITDRDGNIQWVNPAWVKLTGYSLSEAIGKNPSIVKSSLQDEAFYKILWDTILSGQTWRGELINKRKNGSLYTEEEIITPVCADNGKITHFVAIKQDITARKQAEEKNLVQLARLSALREIDLTINSSFDLNLSLNILLSHAIKLLAVDAASVLLINTDLNTLKYAAGVGFRTNKIKDANVSFNGSLSGKVAKERRIVHIQNLADDPLNLLLTRYLKDEAFVCYYGAPLTVKGKIVGVLEVFGRSIMARDEEWFNFFTTLAGQAAMAINNIQLLEELQRANSELIVSYDATITGWSYALDLRDKETEGHSRRVTEISVNLARLLGVNKVELEHIRRGALLHDIGKMGVPDYILQKPEQLTDEEWVIMRKHPVFAYEMLSSIPFLKPALEIPYCHHEKWDGTGYPRGISGEQIPFSARIFALVDVWDALTSDRPYRPAWSRKRALKHIKEQSGKHFDPVVVKAFLKWFDQLICQIEELEL